MRLRADIFKIDSGSGATPLRVGSRARAHAPPSPVVQYNAVLRGVPPQDVDSCKGNR